MHRPSTSVDGVKLSCAQITGLSVNEYISQELLVSGSSHPFVDIQIPFAARKLPRPEALLQP